MENSKKTILSTLWGATASGILASSFVMMPTGKMKDAVYQYELSKSVSAIHTSALFEQGSIANPVLAKSLSSTTPVTHSGLYNSSVMSIPDYASAGARETALDADGNTIQLIDQEQSVTREITLSNGETYTEVYGWKDDLDNYIDALPAEAAVGVVNTSGLGNADGQTYQKYISRDNETILFPNGASPDAQHGVVNTQSSNGPSTIYDENSSTWYSVDTGADDQVGDGSGGEWTSTALKWEEDNGVDWPRAGWNPPTTGVWDLATVRTYTLALYDHYITNDPAYDYLLLTQQAYDWITSVQIGDGSPIAGPDLEISRAEMVSWINNSWGGSYFSNPFIYFFFNMVNDAWKSTPLLIDPNASITERQEGNTLGGTVDLHPNGAGANNSLFGGVGGAGNVASGGANLNTNAPGSNGTWTFNDGSLDNEWTYTGPVFNSDNQSSHSGSTTVYGSTTWDESAGTTIYDQDFKVYQLLPKNLEKQAVLGYNGPGVGDETGNTYYEGTLTEAASQPIQNPFTSDSKSGWIEDTHNTSQIGDGSGRIYERALFFYDKDSNLLHNLPSGEYLVDEQGNLFTENARNTGFGTTGQYEGVGIGALLDWINVNQATMTISPDARSNAAGLGIELIVTETDARYKRILIAIQAAVELMTNVTSQTSFNNALIQFASIVDISDDDRNAISAIVSSASAGTTTHALSEGYTEEIQIFGKSFNVFGDEATIVSAATLLNSDGVIDFFSISSTMATLKVVNPTGTHYYYYDKVGATIAEDLLSIATVNNGLNLNFALPEEQLLDYFSATETGIAAIDNKLMVSNVRYTNFDYDILTMDLEIVLSVGNQQKVVQETVTFTKTYIDWMMNELAIEGILANRDMLQSQPMFYSWEYSIGTEAEVEADSASFALRQSFLDKFDNPVTLVSLDLPDLPAEDDRDIEFHFVVEYEGIQKDYTESFRFLKSRSQQYVEDAIASITEVSTVVSHLDRTISDLTSRSDTFRPFDAFLEGDGLTLMRMSFDNMQVVGGGEVDRDATTIDFTVDITMGAYTLFNHPLTLNLDSSVNQKIIDTLSGDDIRHASPGVATIVDDLEEADWNDPSWWKVQSSWLDILDIAGIAVIGNFRKVDERTFEVELEVTVGTLTKRIIVTQQVGFNLIFAPVIDEATTGISDPDGLQDLIDYMNAFDAQTSVSYIGAFAHALEVSAASSAELLLAWEATLATVSGNATIKSIEINDIHLVTKYETVVSFRVTLEDSYGYELSFNRIHTFAESAVETQLNAATVDMIETSHDRTGQLTDEILTSMWDISDWIYDNNDLGLLDTLSIISVTNSGKIAHITFEFGYSGPLGSNSREFSLDVSFNRRGDQDAALAKYSLGYSLADLSAYYDPNDVDGNGNDWTNVDQVLLDEVVRQASQSRIRLDIEDELMFAYANVIPNLWADTISLASGIETVTTDDIIATLQADLIAGNIIRRTFVDNTLNELVHITIENRIFDIIASEWRLNSASEVTAEILKYNSSFDIEDYYLNTINAVINNINFDTDIALDIVYDTLIPEVMDVALDGISQATDPDYYLAVEDAINNNFAAGYANVIGDIWFNMDDLINKIAVGISQVVIDTQLGLISSVLNTTVTERDRTLDDLIKDLSIFTDEHIKVVSYNLEVGTAINKDTDSFSVELHLTFGAVVNSVQVVTLQLDQTINQAIIGAIDESSFSVLDAKTYPTIQFMLIAMGEDLESGGSGTITDISYITFLEDFIDVADFSFELDINAPLVPDSGSATIFTIGLTVDVGKESKSLSALIQVGAAVDFTLPEFSDGGTFDFSSHFEVVTEVYDNAFDLHRIGNMAVTHLGISEYLAASLVSVASVIISDNSGIDIFSREFYATFTLRDSLGNTRTFVDQLVKIEGGLNKAESVMAKTTDQDIDIADSDLLLGQLTDDLLSTGLHDWTTYSINNDLDVLNDFAIKNVNHRGKFAIITFTVGYDDGNGNSDHVEYQYIFEFAFRADVAWSLDYYGLAMTADELKIVWSPDQLAGNVEQNIVDTIVINSVTEFLVSEYMVSLETFVDGGIYTSSELSADLQEYLNLTKIEEIATEGQTLTTHEVIEKYRVELFDKTLADSLDTIARDTLKASDWAEVSAKYFAVAFTVENTIEADIAAGTFEAKDIWPMIGYELALTVSPEVKAVAENDWVMEFIGSIKPGFIWMVHSTIEAQLTAGFNDAPVLSNEVSGIHVNKNSVNGLFIDEISNLTSFSNMDNYILHLSNTIARLEMPALISDEDILKASNQFKLDISRVLSGLVADGVMTFSDMDVYLAILLSVDNDHPQGFPDANFDAIYSPSQYFTENTDQIIDDLIVAASHGRAEKLGFHGVTELLADVPTYIAASGDDLVITTNSANYTQSETEEEFRDLHQHYLYIRMNELYEDSFGIYRTQSTGNAVRTFNEFLDSYISLMDVKLSVLEGIDYTDINNVESNVDFFALRVDQIQNITDIPGTINRMIVGLGLSADGINDYPYTDLRQFTITLSELEEHLHGEAMLILLSPGGKFETAGNSVGLSAEKYQYATNIFTDLMNQDYPADDIELKTTIEAAILFSSLDDDYYIAIIDLYDVFRETQSPAWVPSITIEEVIAEMDPIIERIFGHLKNDPLYDIVQAGQELVDSQEEIAISLAWTKYELAFEGLFEQLRDANSTDKDKIFRLSLFGLEEYVVESLGALSLSQYVIELGDDDRSFSIDGKPNTLTMEQHLLKVIDGAIQYADELFNTLVDDIATASGYTIQDVLDKTSLTTDAIIIEVNGTTSNGGTIGEVHFLTSQIGKYVFELIIETDTKPDPEINMNGWLVPFAAMITKTNDYETISNIIEERIESGEGSYGNWGFEDIADMMNTFVDKTTEEEIYNATTGKIVMDKFVRANGTSANTWSTTMWLGPIPLRMTYGEDGDISSMETVLLDREEPEDVTSIALSQHYSQNEMTLRFSMADGTTVYIRYVQDAGTHVNVILQRISSSGKWETSELYREDDITQDLSKKDYRVYRDSNISKFNGLDSEFEENMISIYGETVNTNSAKVLNSTVASIGHVWGDNPTVDSFMNISADSSPVVVKKDDVGNTHIQMHLKDITVRNTSVSITARITAGGFRLMWLIWTFIIALGTIGAGSFAWTGVFFDSENKKRNFLQDNPKFDGASRLSILKLRRIYIQREKLTEEYEIALKTITDGVDELKQLKELEEKIQVLEAIALSESDVYKFQKSFKERISGMNEDTLTIESIERAANVTSILKASTSLANRAVGGKFVENSTQEFKQKENIKTVKVQPAPKVGMTEVARKTFEFNIGKLKFNDIKIRDIERGLKAITHVNASTQVPDASQPRKGIDFSPFKKLGLSVDTVHFKNTTIDKNSREQIIEILFGLDGKNMSKDLRIIYPESINENIINNFDKYNLDTTGLARFESTIDKTFTEANVRNVFKSNAPNTKVLLVKGSLTATGKKSFEAKLHVRVGTKTRIVPYKGSL